MGQVKKRNENLKIFHPLLFFISLFRPCRCQIYIDSRLHIVQSPSWKVVADGGRASGAFFANVEKVDDAFVPPKVRARRRDQKHFLVGRISVISESVVFLSRRENVLL